MRLASSGDVAGAAEVHGAAALAAYAHIFPPEAPKPTPADLIEEWRSLVDDPETTVLVAADPTAIVGVGVLAPDDGVPAGLLLKRLYVEPARWGHRIGARLHDRIVDDAAGRGASAIDLWVLERNHRARAMYERWGWSLVDGPRLGNGWPGIDDVLYERTVS